MNTKNKRFPRPVAIDILDDEDNDVVLFKGETDGINQTGLGANIRSMNKSKQSLEIGDICKIKIHLPIPGLESPRAEVIRVEEPKGEDAEFIHDQFAAFRFEKPIDDQKIWDHIGVNREFFGEKLF